MTMPIATESTICEQLTVLNYCFTDIDSINLPETFVYVGLSKFSTDQIALIYRENEKNFLEFQNINGKNLTSICLIELREIIMYIDDFTWSPIRQEFLIMSDGQLLTYDHQHNQITNVILVDQEKRKCRVACNSTLIACVDTHNLILYDLTTLTHLRQKRLDHVCEDIEFDDQYFLSTHNGKLEILDRKLRSIRRFPLGGTSVCQYNSNLWLVADSFDHRLLWQSLEKRLLTVPNIHQPKSIVVLSNTGRILLLCTEPNRLLIFDPIQSDG